MEWNGRFRKLKAQERKRKREKKERGDASLQFQVNVKVIHRTDLKTQLDVAIDDLEGAATALSKQWVQHLLL